MLIETLFITTTILGASTFSTNSIKIIGGKSNVTEDICFTLHSRTNGWAAIGVGSTRMSEADMYIGWANSTGGTTLTQASAPGHVQPVATSFQIARVVPLIDTAGAFPGGLSFSFCRPQIATQGKSIAASTSYIYAYSNNAPSQKDDPKSSYSFHDGYNSFSIDYTVSLSGNSSGGGSVSGSESGAPILSTTNYANVLVIHGILMWIGWIFITSFGILAAKFGKHLIGDNWFPIHWGLMGLGTTLFSLAGVIYLYLYKSPPHFDNLHAKIGLAITIVMILEVILGNLINWWWDPARTSVPLSDQIHHWTGRILFLLAIINVQLGFNEYGENYSLSVVWVVLNWVFVTIVVGVFGYLQYAYGDAKPTHYRDSSAPLFEDRAP